MGSENFPSSFGNGNPGRASYALGTCLPPCHHLAALGLAKSSRDATLPAKPAKRRLRTRLPSPHRHRLGETRE